MSNYSLMALLMPFYLIGFLLMPVVSALTSPVVMILFFGWLNFLLFLGHVYRDKPEIEKGFNP